MSCLSDLKLDELVRDELAAADEARAHIAGCTRCAARLKEIEEERAAFLAEELRLPKQARQPRRSRVAGWLSLAAGFAVSALGVKWALQLPEGERLKGGPQLSLFVRHAEKVRPAGPREPVSPGDTLQFTYSSDRTRYLAVLSLDGSGRGNIYFPDSYYATPVAAGRDVPLARSTVLDEVLGPETLYGLFCDKDIGLAGLRNQLDAERRLTPPDGCSLITLSIEKK